jgi:hypothetical protein
LLYRNVELSHNKLLGRHIDLYKQDGGAEITKFGSCVPSCVEASDTATAPYPEPNDQQTTRY